MSTFERIDAIIDDIAGMQARTNDSKLEDELDSLDAVELEMAIEEEFNISVDDDLGRAWLTVGDVVKYVDTALADNSLSA